MGAPVAPPTSTGKEFKRQFKPMNLSAVEAMSEREIRSALEARGADHTDCTTIDHLKDRLKEVRTHSREIELILALRMVRIGVVD